MESNDGYKTQILENSLGKKLSPYFLFSYSIYNRVIEVFDTNKLFIGCLAENNV